MSKVQDNVKKGCVLEIQRMSTEDGPGIRTTIFLKGCSLACAWCHNPESIAMQPQVQWIGNRCIGCDICIRACEKGALERTETGIVIDRTLCVGCGECAEACPSTAMELLGTEWDSASLIEEVIKDRAYFERSNGGITIGGGELTLQTDFAVEILRGLKDLGIHTAIDTCGNTTVKNLEKLLPFSDMVLYDLKEIDPDLHKRYTGSSNERVLENAKFINRYISEHRLPVEMWIRTPVIPGATARKENIAGIGRFIAGHLKESVTRWELLAFNNLCRDKYTRLNKTWEFSDTPLCRKDDMERLAGVAVRSGVGASIVHWSGSTLLENDRLQEHKQHAAGRFNACTANHLPVEETT